MQKHPWHLIIMAFAFIVVGLASTAHAVSSYRTSFNATYPAAAATLGNCTLCHPGGNTNNFNPYANAYANSGYSFAAIQPLDSDGDGFTNIAEINALTYPGDATSKPVVAPPAVTLVSIAISGPASVNENGTATYAATATMSNNTTKAVTATWSENSTATTISAAGVLTATAVTANQAVTVSASYTEGGITQTANYAVTVVDVPVTPPAVTLVSIAISGPASVNENGTATYAATATMSNNTTKAVTATWSENSTATTISAAGVLTATAVTANQAVTVSASYTEGGITRTANYAVTVVDVPVTPPSTADSDSDGMPNAFELAYGLDPNEEDDANLNPDGDGLSNLNEHLAGTHPKNPDTDGDGVWDGSDLVPNDKTRPVIDEKGVRRYGVWFMDDGSSAWNADKDLIVTGFGAPKDLPVVGDWNGDGIDKVGVFRNGQWYLDNNANDSWDAGIDTAFAAFGGPGDLPVAGDWNGDGKAQIAVYRGGTWYLDNGSGQWESGIDTVAVFGAPTDRPVAGDINGDGKAEIGVYRPETGMWYFDRDNNGNWSGCGIDLCAGPFGAPADLPVMGDWNGDGKSEVGVYRQGTWYIDNGNIQWDAGADKTYTAFGAPSDIPVVGDWNNDGKSDIGAMR